LSGVLDGAIESEVVNIFVCIVGHVPCTTSAFCAEIPTFVVILAHYIGVLGRIFDPTWYVFESLGLFLVITV